MASKIEIYNMALGHVGMKKLFDTLTSNPSLTACELYYKPALIDTYSECDWSFANVKEQFSEVSVNVVGWDYVYAYPPKAANVLNVFSEANVKHKEEQLYEIVFIPASNKKVVCSNEAEAYQEYTYIVEDTTIFSPKFVIALSFKLAAMIAHGLTSDPALAGKLLDDAAFVIHEAKRIDAQEKIKRVEQTNEIVSARE